MEQKIVQVVLFEDEHHAEERLIKLIQDLRPNYQITATFDTIEEGVEFIKTSPKMDLIFMDIQLADGLSFDIFNQVSVNIPVIFTTAFDQYAIKAFKFYSVDYLLKPIDPNELKTAVEQFEKNFQQSPLHLPNENLQALTKELTSDQAVKDKRTRFLVKKGDSFFTIENPDVAYLYSEDGLTILRSKFGEKYVLDQSLDYLIEELPVHTFFRISRKVILNHTAIQKMHTWPNHRLKIDLNPQPNFQVIVSRDRVKDFKAWLNQ